MPDHLTSVAARLRSGEVGLDAYIDQLAELFSAVEPEVLAFVPEEGRFDRLRREAGELEELYPDPASRPPLFGVAVGVKDIFHVSGHPTRAGSQLPENELAGSQGEAVGLLRRNGALILGKTATTEFAYFAPSVARNPRAPGHTPGGSSSGSAAAVAAGLCPLALGTQTIGSISRPAAFCGVVGFKPTYGRISTAGVLPLAPSLDHVGLFVDRVADASLAASILCRSWSPFGEIRRPRLGIPAGPYLERTERDALERFENSCRRLQEAGFEVSRQDVMADFASIERRHDLILAAEASQVHGRWFAPFRRLYHSRTAELIERGLTIPREDLGRALEERKGLVDELEGPIVGEEIDLWISPAAPGAAPAGLESTGDPVMNLPWSQAGMPTVALPSGSDAAGFPLGLQIAERRGEDESLLAASQSIEEALGRRS